MDNSVMKPISPGVFSLSLNKSFNAIQSAKYALCKTLVNWLLLTLRQHLSPVIFYAFQQYRMTTPALQARVHKLLSSRAELEATRSLLCTLVTEDGTSLVQLDASTETEASSLATVRRTLRSSLEKQQLSLAQKALDGYERTLEHVSDLAAQVTALDVKCAQIVDFLEKTKIETQQVQTEAAAIAQKRWVLF